MQAQFCFFPQFFWFFLVGVAIQRLFCFVLFCFDLFCCFLGLGFEVERVFWVLQSCVFLFSSDSCESFFCFVFCFFCVERVGLQKPWAGGEGEDSGP